MIGEISRYTRTALYNRDYEIPVLGIRSRFMFSTELCQFYTWKLGDTLDRISYNYYGLPDFRWAILDANPQYRSELDIQIGDHILIPDADEIFNIVDTDSDSDDTDDDGYIDEYDYYEDEDEDY